VCQRLAICHLGARQGIGFGELSLKIVEVALELREQCGQYIADVNILWRHVGVLEQEFLCDTIEVIELVGYVFDVLFAAKFPFITQVILHLLFRVGRGDLGYYLGCSRAGFNPECEDAFSSWHVEDTLVYRPQSPGDGTVEDGFSRQL
jgi:hypothetical protein